MNRRYPLDVFPGTWSALVGLFVLGELISTREVFSELEDMDDAATKWAKDHRAIFLPSDTSVAIEAASIVQKFETLVEIDAPRTQADPFVIALAKLRGATVVTEERRTGWGASRVKIPDVCGSLGLECISVLQLFRAQKWSWSKKDRGE